METAQIEEVLRLMRTYGVTYLRNGDFEANIAVSPGSFVELDREPTQDEPVTFASVKSGK